MPSWYHEYGFSGGEDFEAVVEFATAHGFTFVYGGATRDDAWVGYPAECDRLVAAVREAEARAERAERELSFAEQTIRDKDTAWEATTGQLLEARARLAAVSGEAPNDE